MIRLVLLVAALAGCDVLWGIDKLSPGTSGDDGGMMPFDGPPVACSLAGKSGPGPRKGMLVDCVPQDGSRITLEDEQVNTDTDPRCIDTNTMNAEASRVCVIHAQTIDVNGMVVASGSLPLVLAANTITVSGTLDLSQPNAAGVQSPTVNCTGMTGLAGLASVGGGAGASGGSFGTRGGKGGKGKTVLQTAAGVPTAFPDDIRAGCPGGNGGNGTTAGNEGKGSGPGGAVYLIARQAIHLGPVGVINASGRGGHGGTASNGGGGGGGTGGFIGFDAPFVTFDISTQPGAQVFANGGGGGGGGLATAGTAGSSTGAAMGADGGPTNGGNGPIRSQPGGDGADETGMGGGGGAGGQGHIVIFSQDVTTIDVDHVSPPPHHEP